MTGLDVDWRADDLVALTKGCQDTTSLRPLTPLGFQNTAEDLLQPREVCPGG
jgi:hypothetical protein